MATVSCPHCSQSLELPDDVAGKAVRCPSCQQTFAIPASSSLASGEPPAQSAKTDDALTAKAPTGRASTEPDSDDIPTPRDRRDIEKTSLLVPIAIVAGVAILGLCLCGGPALIFLGTVPFAMVRHEEQAVAVRAADEQAVAMAEAKVAKAKEMTPAFAKGLAAAQDAIAQDKLLLKEYPPLPAPGWHGEFIKQLKERCKCDYQVIGAPNLPKDQVDEIKGWNDAMETELRRRHGATIIGDLNKDAEQRWRDRIKAKGNR